MYGWLIDDDVKLLGYNLAFDMTVVGTEHPDLIPLIFRKYDLFLCEDLLLNEQLLDIADGHFRWEVDEMTDEYIGRKKYGLGDLYPEMDKTTYRFGFGPLRDVPVYQWPAGYRAYALGDAVNTAHRRRVQQERALRTRGIGRVDIPDAPQQATWAFALHLMSCWGVRTDPQRVHDLEQKLLRSTNQLRMELMLLGLIDPKKGSRAMSAIREAIAESGAPLVYTAGGQISTSSDVLTLAAQKMPELHHLVTYQEHQKLLGTYLPPMKAGTYHPVNASFNPIVETGRTSCSRPNLQNLPRGKKKTGDLAHLVRECFVPRTGYWYCSTDYDSLEVRTLGQGLYDLVGGETLLRNYQRDPDFDPHTNMAARILGISYEDAMARKKAKDPELLETRQMSKAAVFGYPGGMGPQKMISYAFKSYGVELDIIRSKSLKNSYSAALPDINPYWTLNSNFTQNGDGRAAALRTGRVRGGLRFTDACNGWFQQLAADGAKRALWEVTKRCYIDHGTALFGCRPVVFVHDEIIAEMPHERAPWAAVEMEQVMCDTMRMLTPDIPSRASPALMDRWYKGADAVYDSRGMVTLWQPRA